MNRKRLLFCCAVAVWLSIPAARVLADDTTPLPAPTDQHPGSNLPLLGNMTKAATLVRSGNIAVSAGKIEEAQSYYESALAASPGLQDAILGLARCATAQGDFGTAVGHFQSAINGHQEEYNINLLSEYTLALVQGGYRQEAVKNYNHVIDLCKQGYSVAKMPVLPPTFLKNGSDYQPAKMQAMLHLVRAMNASTSDDKRIQSEIQQAVDLAPNSSLVYYYKATTMLSKDKSGAMKLFQRALRLDDGSHSEAINKAMTLTQ